MRITGLLWEESTGHLKSMLTKARYMEILYIVSVNKLGKMRSSYPWFDFTLNGPRD